MICFVHPVKSLTALLSVVIAIHLMKPIYKWLFRWFQKCLEQTFLDLSWHYDSSSGKAIHSVHTPSNLLSNMLNKLPKPTKNTPSRSMSHIDTTFFFCRWRLKGADANIGQSKWSCRVTGYAFLKFYFFCKCIWCNCWTHPWKLYRKIPTICTMMFIPFSIRINRVS
jgi:hypothetical protein